MQEKSLPSMSSDNPTVDANVNSEVHKQDIPAVNEEKELSEKPCPQELTLTGTTNESVTLQISHLLYIEAVGNYMKVCHLRNEQVRTDMLRATNHSPSRAATWRKSRKRLSEEKAELA